MTDRNQKRPEEVGNFEADHTDPKLMKHGPRGSAPIRSQQIALAFSGQGFFVLFFCPFAQKPVRAFRSCFTIEQLARQKRKGLLSSLEGYNFIIISIRFFALLH
ncbi:hypothetical protein [Paenibacillus humicus]|uniref:hypothetical protein n=1 Tax=Paenibacillus humicus TaxID=412861 RepID=UPI000FD7A802|nr:hypothetical protein [Paenibacillus humicus]